MNLESIDSAPPSESPTHSVRENVWAAMISAIVPGTGQLLTGRLRAAALFGGLWVALLFLAFVLRIERFYLGCATVLLGSFGLGIVASCNAIKTRRDGNRLSPRWLVFGFIFSLAGGSVDANLITRGSGFKTFIVPSASMEPTILTNDFVMGDMRAYRSEQVHRGDVIAFERPEGYYSCKRVIAVGDDSIEGRSGEIFLNGEELTEDYVKHTEDADDPSYPELRTFGPLKVPAGKLFVMGDSRDFSMDSRVKDFGLVDAKNAVKILYVIRSSDEKHIGHAIR
jgi:signal peptidase I